MIKLFNDEEYLKIKKIVWDEVGSVLLDGKRLLRLASYSLMKSMRKDPDKDTALTYYADYTDYLGNKSGEYSHQLNSYDSFFKALESTILEDANELYEQLLREQANTIIADYVSNGNSLILPTSPTNSQPSDISKGS